jgi:hypothetical protein
MPCIVLERHCICENGEGYQCTDQEHLRVRCRTCFPRSVRRSRDARRWTGAIRGGVQIFAVIPLDGSDPDLKPVTSEYYCEAEDGEDELFHRSDSTEGASCVFGFAVITFCPLRQGRVGNPLTNCSTERQ